MNVAFYEDFVTQGRRGPEEDATRRSTRSPRAACGRAPRRSRRGLVDRLGGLDVALARRQGEGRRSARTRTLHLVVLPERKGFFETLLERQDERRSASVRLPAGPERRSCAGPAPCRATAARSRACRSSSRSASRRQLPYCCRRRLAQACCAPRGVVAVDPPEGLVDAARLAHGPQQVVDAALAALGHQVLDEARARRGRSPPPRATRPSARAVSPCGPSIDSIRLPSMYWARPSWSSRGATPREQVGDEGVGQLVDQRAVHVGGEGGGQAADGDADAPVEVVVRAARPGRRAARVVVALAREQDHRDGGRGLVVERCGPGWRSGARGRAGSRGPRPRARRRRSGR